MWLHLLGMGEETEMYRVQLYMLVIIGNLILLKYILTWAFESNVYIHFIFQQILCSIKGCNGIILLRLFCSIFCDFLIRICYILIRRFKKGKVFLVVIYWTTVFWQPFLTFWVNMFTSSFISSFKNNETPERKTEL